MNLSATIRNILKKIAKKSGLYHQFVEAVEDGRIILNPNVTIPNFIFQRILGVNRDCKWNVHYTSTVINSANIELGKGVRRSFALSCGCYIQAINGIKFGDNVMFGPGVKIISANHDIGHMERRSYHVSGEQIIISDNCWIGANAVILPGVKLGRNVIVGAGAIVTKSFTDNAVIAGNPAKVIRFLAEKPSR